MDASALVALIENEDGSAAILAGIGSAETRLWSPMSCWEAVSALQNSYHRPVDQARDTVAAYAAAYRFRLVPIAAHELAIALDAYQAYGKGRHRANLNFGDCFAYACAKANGVQLLYKGDDFAKTDLA